MMWARPFRQSRAAVIVYGKSLNSLQAEGERGPASGSRVLKELLAAPRRGSQGAAELELSTGE